MSVTDIQCLGHQRLISLLLPTLLDTSLSNPSSLPRIISTSSAGHTAAPPGGFDPVSAVRDPDSTSTNDKPVKGKNELAKWTEYGQSKWGNIAVARYIHWLYGPAEGTEKKPLGAERAGKGEIIAISVHPGSSSMSLTMRSKELNITRFDRYEPRPTSVAHSLHHQMGSMGSCM